MGGNFEEEIFKSIYFQGQVGMAANSLEIIIDEILIKGGIKPQRLLSGKIKQLKEIIEDDKLIDELTKFNATWNITKHGKIAVGIKEYIAFRKDERTYLFDNKRQEEIMNRFSSMMKRLMEIQSNWDC